MGFTDKRVLVAGSSRGIGFAIAKAFVDAGARVAINGRTTDSVSAAMERLGDGACLVAAPAVVFLASDQSSFVTGEFLVVDGGGIAG